MTLVISLSLSHRTPAMVKLKRVQIPEHLRDVANRRFFGNLVD